MWSRSVLWVIAILVAGCAGLGAPKPHSPLPNVPIASEADAALLRNLGERYDAVQKYCSDLLYGYKQKTDAARTAALTIAALGTIAGAIVVPALAAQDTIMKSTIAAWGGVAGAANTAQNFVQETGVSPEQQYAVRENLRTKLLDLAAKYNELYTEFPGKTKEQFGIINKMQAECDFPPIAGASVVRTQAQGAQGQTSAEASTNPEPPK
jgi:hypothetical protein